MATTKSVLELNFRVAEEESKAFEGHLRPKLGDVMSLTGVDSVDVYKQESARPKPTVVFVLGGPGAGKGTQCTRITEEFGFHHISAGDCLREERASGSADADLINTFIKEGKIVPVEITIKLLLKAMEVSGNSKFLIDGFPRDLENLLGWEAVVGDRVNVEFVLFFDCPEDVMLCRLLKRGETSGRTDDNITSIRKRFFVYNEATMPVVHRFEKTGKVRVVKADQPVELVYMNVQRIFRDLAAVSKPFVSWTIQYKPKDGYGVDGCQREAGVLVEGVKKLLPADSLSVTTRVLTKIVDEKVPEGSCVIC